MEISFSKYTTLYKKLNKDINNLKNIGRFLALWDCTTGLPKTNPTELPYIYKTGDYYRIQNTSEEGTKYIPNGSQYTGEASTTIDTEDSKTEDIWFYDGTTWSRQTGGGGSGTIDSETVTTESSTPLFPFVEYVSQTLTSEQQAIARANIGCLSLLDIVISLSQVISSDPLTVQFTSEQDAIITSNDKFINIDATAIGTGVTTFFKEKTNIEGDYMLISPTANYNASSLIPQSQTTQAIVYRHSTMIGVHKELQQSGTSINIIRFDV